MHCKRNGLCCLGLDFCLAQGYVLGAATDMDQTYSITVDSADWTYPI